MESVTEFGGQRLLTVASHHGVLFLTGVRRRPVTEMSHQLEASHSISHPQGRHATEPNFGREVGSWDRTLSRTSAGSCSV